MCVFMLYLTCLTASLNLLPDMVLLMCNNKLRKIISNIISNISKIISNISDIISDIISRCIIGVISGGVSNIMLRHLSRNSYDSYRADGDDLNVDDLRMPRQRPVHLNTHTHTHSSVLNIGRRPTSQFLGRHPVVSIMFNSSTLTSDQRSHSFLEIGAAGEIMRRRLN